jgi:UDP-3-O-[3-hydroxymyristoyl] glucosamine N-acyltransferase
LRLRELTELLGGSCEGDPDTRIRAAAGLDDAEPGAIVRVESQKFLARAAASRASALLLPPGLDAGGKPCIRVAEPRIAFLRCLEIFQIEEQPPPGIHPTAVVGPGAELDASCSVGPYAVLGRNVRVGPGAAIHAHAVLGDDVEVGAATIIYPHAVLYARTLVGARARIHAGAVIGSDGFGYEWTGEAHQKRPHNGRVVIGDDVEIGANTTIDRATTAETSVGPGTKIDNLVQIGHNCRIGAHSIIVAQAGLSGSVVLGQGVAVGGQAGLAQHVTLGDGAKAAGQAGVGKHVPAGMVVSGTPARPHRDELRVQAAVRRVPELLDRLRRLELLLGKGECK